MSKLGSKIFRRLWIFFSIFSFIFFKGLNAVRIIDVKVPPQVKSGDSVTLTCVFDLEGQTLYSLNWWRNNVQFYQFDLSEGIQQIVYETRGIHVNKKESNLRQVKLLNVTSESAGDYKCEIVADYPSYERDYAIAPLEVVVVPSISPTITLEKSSYQMGDHLRANCTAPGATPLPIILWYINGKKIKSNHVKHFYDLKRPKKEHRSHHHKEHHKEHHHKEHHNSNKEHHHKQQQHHKRFIRSIGTSNDVTSHASLVLKRNHFLPDGRVMLTCTAFYSNLFSRSSKLDLTKPRYSSSRPSLRISRAASTKSSVPFFLAVLLLILIH